MSFNNETGSQVNVDTTINNLSLCAGGGGLDLGLELVLPSLRTVCWVEWEGFAIDYLATRMEAQCLSPAPIWSDLRTFDGKPWCGVVDFVTAGYPCQPFSTAGSRRGTDDPRHLWPSVHRVIGEVEPSFVLLENVSGHTSLGAEQVVSDLQGLGYETAAGLFTAAEVGASHKRERFFILGLADSLTSGWSQGEPLWSGQPHASIESKHLDDTTRNVGSGQNGETRRRRRVCEASQPNCSKLAHSTSSRCSGWEDSRTGCGDEGEDKSRCTESKRSCAGSDHSRPQRRCMSEQRCSDERTAWSPSSAFPPGPDAIDEWQGVPIHLWPALEPGICELVDGLAIDRTRYLKLLGNGVVPLQAAYAFVSLWSVLASRGKPVPASAARKEATEASYALAV
jgi:DNA (cytosine-5)-methyltransferase 1